MDYGPLVNDIVSGNELCTISVRTKYLIFVHVVYIYHFSCFSQIKTIVLFGSGNVRQYVNSVN